ncbi:hypothetical protein GALL_339030 [mine drainage metagenome]|uniref:Uncharacterized protein n=1 Tax=mine drainage metagenome TaxID=410659 RepID=A0A1J5QLR8_9ZZZZ
MKHPDKPARLRRAPLAAGLAALILGSIAADVGAEPSADAKRRATSQGLKEGKPRVGSKGPNMKRILELAKPKRHDGGNAAAAYVGEPKKATRRALDPQRLEHLVKSRKPYSPSGTPTGSAHVLGQPQAVGIARMDKPNASGEAKAKAGPYDAAHTQRNERSTRLATEHKPRPATGHTRKLRQATRVDASLKTGAVALYTRNGNTSALREYDADVPPVPTPYTVSPHANPQHPGSAQPSLNSASMDYPPQYAEIDETDELYAYLFASSGNIDTLADLGLDTHSGFSLFQANYVLFKSLGDEVLPDFDAHGDQRHLKVKPSWRLETTCPLVARRDPALISSPLQDPAWEGSELVDMIEAEWDKEFPVHTFYPVHFKQPSKPDLSRLGDTPRLAALVIRVEESDDRAHVVLLRAAEDASWLAVRICQRQASDGTLVWEQTFTPIDPSKIRNIEIAVYEFN